MAGIREVGPVRIKYASISGTGTTEIVAAVSNKQISVISFLVTGTANATMIFKSATDNLTGAMSLGITGSMGDDTISPLVGPWNPDGHFHTAVGEALNITASAGTSSGYLTYIEI